MNMWLYYLPHSRRHLSLCFWMQMLIKAWDQGGKEDVEHEGPVQTFWNTDLETESENWKSTWIARQRARKPGTCDAEELEGRHSWKMQSATISNILVCSCWVSQNGKAPTDLSQGHFSVLCLQKIVVKDDVMPPLLGNKAWAHDGSLLKQWILQAQHSLVVMQSHHVSPLCFLGGKD